MRRPGSTRVYPWRSLDRRNLVGWRRVQSTTAVASWRREASALTKWTGTTGSRSSRWREKGISGSGTSRWGTSTRPACEGLAGDFESLAVTIVDNLGESGLELLSVADDVGGALQALGKVLDIGAGAEAPVVGARVQSGLDGRARAIALRGVGIGGGLASLQDVSE